MHSSINLSLYHQNCETIVSKPNNKNNKSGLNPTMKIFHPDHIITLSDFSNLVHYIFDSLKKYSVTEKGDNLNPSVLCAALLNVLEHCSTFDDKQLTIDLINSHIAVLKKSIERIEIGMPSTNVDEEIKEQLSTFKNKMH